MRIKIGISLVTSVTLSLGVSCLAQGFSMQTAYSMFQQKNWNGLAAYANNWTRAQPNDGLAWYCVGEAAFHQKRFADAVTGYQRATQLMPEHASYYNDLAAAYTAVGNNDLALNAVRQGESALARSPSAKYWYVFGNAEQNLGQWDQAISNYQKAINLNPSFGEAWTNMGTVYCVRKNNNQEGLRCLDKGAQCGNALGRSNAQIVRYRMAHPDPGPGAGRRPGRLYIPDYRPDRASTNSALPLNG